MPNALGPVVLIKEMPLTWNTRMAIMNWAKFSKQKGSTKNIFLWTKQQFRESHLEIVSLLVVVVRPSSVVVFKNFCSFPSAIKRAAFGLPGSAASGSLAALGIIIRNTIRKTVNETSHYTLRVSFRKLKFIYKREREKEREREREREREKHIFHFYLLNDLPQIWC